MRLKVLLFAEAKERAESDFLWIEVEQNTTREEIFAQLAAVCDDLQPLLSTCQLAQNLVRTVRVP